MQRPFPPAIAALALVATLAACARDPGNYPSLSPRPIEKLGFAEPETKNEEAKPDPALDATIAAKRQAFAALSARFAEAAAKAGTAAMAARGKPVGSDAWLEAQTLLAGLDDVRAQTSALATDVDTMNTDRAATLAPPYPALVTLRDDIQAESTKQGETIDRLSTSLPAG